MTLREAMETLDSHDEGSTIYAEEPWTETSEVVVSPESNGKGIIDSSGKRLAYFLEVFITRDVIEGWKANLVAPPQIEEICERIIYYATYDA